MIKPIHQGISVVDMDAAMEWYQRVFGFQVDSDEWMPMLNCRVVFLSLNGFSLELFQYMGEDRQPLPPQRLQPNEDLKTCGTKHVAYGVENMEAMMKHLQENEVDIALGPMDVNGQKVCFIRDCGGTLIELIEQ